MVKKDRIFAGFGAGLFLMTSSALAIAVIISLSQSSSSKGTPSNSTSAAASKSRSAKQSSSTAQAPVPGSKLQGFKPLTKPVTKLEIGNIQTGKGTLVKSGATVTAYYVGALADTGVIFGTSASSPGKVQTFSLKQVIKGWQVGIPGMRVGGTRELIIPAAWGYGSKGSGSIPPNSDLVFLVTITKAKNP
jgi:FKBP-type peptidyl-prolyl cis-trans isomerase